MNTFAAKIFLFFSFSVFLLGGCQGIDGNHFVTYNNAIISINDKYLERTKAVDAFIQDQNPDIAHYLSEFKKIQGDAELTYKTLQEIPVPKESERLSQAMNKVFELEIQSFKDIVKALEDVQASGGSEESYTALDKTVDEYISKSEQEAQNFDKTQQEIADQFKVEIEPPKPIN